MSYLPLEKLAYSLVIASHKLKHYFKAYSIIVKTSFPLIIVLRKVDLSGRMSKCSMELGRFYICYQPITPMRGYFLVDIIIEFVGERILEKEVVLIDQEIKKISQLT